jgi:hypothetical protein
MKDKTSADAYKEFEAARDELHAYSRRLGLISGDLADPDAQGPDLVLTVDTAEELLRLDAKAKEAWEVYLNAKEAERP